MVTLQSLCLAAAAPSDVTVRQYMGSGPTTRDVAASHFEAHAVCLVNCTSAVLGLFSD